MNFKINSRPLFTIIFKLKNINFRTRDFSPLISRVLSGVSGFSNSPIIDLFLPVRDVIGHDKIELIDFVVNFLAHLVIN